MIDISKFEDQSNSLIKKQQQGQEDPGLLANIEADADIPFSDRVIDAAVGFGGGIEKAAINAADLVNLGWEPIIREPKTFAGKISKGVSQFLTFFMPASAGLKAAGLAAKAAKGAQALGAGAEAAGTIGTAVSGAAAGAVSDFVAFDEHEERLSNLIQENEALANPITEFLAADKEDSKVVGRLKNVLEGGILGVAAEGVFAGLRGIKALRAAKAAGKNPDEVAKAFEQASKKVEEVVSNNKQVLEAADDGSVKPILKTEYEARLKQASDNIFDRAKVKELSTDKISTEALASKVRKFVEDGAVMDPTNLGKKAGGINLSKIKTTDDVKALTRAVEDAVESFGDSIPPVKNADHVIEAFREIDPDITRGDLQKLIDQNKVSAAQLQDINKKLTASRFLHAEVAESLRDATMKAMDSPEAQKEWAKQVKVFAALNDAQTKVSSELGRGLQQQQIVAANKNLFKGLDFERLATDKDYAAFFGNRLITASSAEGMAQVLKDGWFNRIIRGLNLYRIGAMLSALPGAGADAISTGMRTLYTPLNEAMGSALRLDPQGVGKAYKKVTFMVESMRDASRLAMKSIRTGEGSLVTTKSEWEKILQEGNLAINQLNNGGSIAQVMASVGHVAAFIPRIRMGLDEFFKQVVARSNVKSNLITEAATRGLSPEDAANFVLDGMDNIFRKGESLISEESLMKEGIENGRALGKVGPDLIDHATEFARSKHNEFYESLAEGAAEEARIATFQQPLNGFLKDVEDLIIRYPAMRLLIPFYKTMINLTDFSTDFMPGINLLKEKHRAALMSPDPVVRAQAVAHQATSVVFTWTALDWAMSGRITGSGPDSSTSNGKALKASLLSTGWRPYSIKIGDEYYSYQRIEPVATLLGIAADLVEINNDYEDNPRFNAEDIVPAVITALKDNLLNKTYMKSLADFFEALNAEGSSGIAKGHQYIQSVISSFVPRAIANTRQLAGEKYLREVRSYIDSVKNQLPGISQSLPVRRDFLGEPIPIWSHQMSGLSAYFNPVSVSKSTSSIIHEEIIKLGRGFSKPGVTRMGVNLTEVEDPETGHTAYDRYQLNIGQVKIGGKTLKEAMEAKIQSKSYQKLDPTSLADVESPRVTELRKVLSKYREAAFQKTIKEIPQVGELMGTNKQIKAGARQGGKLNELAAKFNVQKQ